jgi:hypothetical protein
VWIDEELLMGYRKVYRRQRCCIGLVVDEWVGSRWGTNNRDERCDAGKREVLSKGRGRQELGAGRGESARAPGRNLRSAR